MKKRDTKQEILDFLTLPIRGLFMYVEGKWGFTSLRDERFMYVAKEVHGRCLDVGCGEGNLFIKNYLNGKGKGIDVYNYDGKLAKKNIIKDITHFPFTNSSFDTVTLIACINHIPKKIRDAELSEVSRVLKKKGKIIVTMGNSYSEFLVHKAVYLHDKIFGTKIDMDSIRGMEEGEEYSLSDQEIIRRLKKAGFNNIRKKYFPTQWFLNHMFIASKR